MLGLVLQTACCALGGRELYLKRRYEGNSLWSYERRLHHLRWAAAYFSLMILIGVLEWTAQAVLGIG